MFRQVKNQQAKRRQANSTQFIKQFERQPTHRPLSQLAMLCLCAALLFVQTLGHVHRTTHWSAQGLSSLVQPALADYQAASALGASHVDHGLSGLFKHHQELSKCQLFDGVGSAQALASDIDQVGVAPPGLILSAFYNVFVVERLTRHFQARAPPYV